ncbi:MAG: TlpA family protein disulfide reductase [bacterium]|nr:TlpA family protein disulfide reductase [bacterium]
MMNSLLRNGSLPLLGGLVLLTTGCAVGVGDAAPNWMLQDTAGKPHALDHYRGQVVVLDFWAVWCGPCIEVSPHMQALHERFADRGVAVLGIHYNDVGDPAAYQAEHGYTFPVMHGGKHVADRYGVSMIPTVIIIGRDGLIIHRQTGFTEGDEKQWIELIEQQLAASS